MSPIGVCIGESSSDSAVFISKGMPRMGEYVTLDYEGKRVLGMIEGIVRGSPSITGDIIDPEVVERILRFEGSEEHYVRGRVKLLGDIERLHIPRVPPPPGTRVEKADTTSLERIFSRGDIRVGTLLSDPGVEVRVDASRMITRHLAILAITGAGKSNTVSVIMDKILELSGLPVIFDMHSEYSDASFCSGVKRIEPRLNPAYLSAEEFKILVDVGRDAHLQERYLRKAYSMAKESMGRGRGDFIGEVISALEGIQESEERFTQSEKGAIVGVINKVEDFQHKYSGLVDAYSGNILSQLEQGKANVVDLGSVDEDYADVIVSHVLRKLLYRRKSRELPPAFCILEEAHLLAPAYRPTLSKYWIERVAREGRKFGIGLCLVSQRPKSLDSNSLSQMNNSIIMRLVEPTDQRHVQQSSERLSDDLLEQLTSLNVGEAVVLGMMLRVPALVKIDRFEGKLSGGDPEIVEEWQRLSREGRREKEEQKSEVEDIYGSM